MALSQKHISSIKQFLKHPYLSSPVVLSIIWFGTALVGCLLKLPADKSISNYIIFKQSFFHSIEQLPLYNFYPQECIDRFLYGIPFTTIIAPFSVLPDFFGMTLWCMANSLLLYVAIKRLDLQRQKFAAIIWLCVNELFTGVIMQQYNIAIAGMIILSFALIERKKEFWAAFMIILGAMTKVYGIVGLIFILFSERKKSLLISLIFWFAIMLVIPMIYLPPQYVIEQYQQWGSTLLDKNSNNQFELHTNISLLGMVRKISGSTLYSDIWIILAGAALFNAPFLRKSQYRYKKFRLLYLCSALMVYVLFSTGTENSGYIGAMVAASLWFITTPTRLTTPVTNSILMAFCFILTSLSPTDIFPSMIRKTYVIPYALKALPCILIWLKIVWEQMTFDFGKEPKTLF